MPKKSNDTNDTNNMINTPYAIKERQIISENEARIIIQLKNKWKSFRSSLSENEKDIIKQYSNLAYVYMNAILRYKSKQLDILKHWNLNYVVIKSELFDVIMKTYNDPTKSFHTLPIGMIPGIIKNVFETHKNKISELDKIFKKTLTMDTPMTLFRGDLVKDREFFNNIKKGDIINFPAYTSTSLNIQTSREFASMDMSFLGAQDDEEENREKPQTSFYIENKNKEKTRTRTRTRTPKKKPLRKGVIFVIVAPKKTPYIFIDSINKEYWQEEILLPRGLRIEVTAKKLDKDIYMKEFIPMNSPDQNNKNNNKNKKKDKKSLQHELFSNKWDNMNYVYGKIIGFDNNEPIDDYEIEENIPVLIDMQTGLIKKETETETET